MWNVLLEVAADPEVEETVYVFDAIDECEEKDQTTLTEVVKTFY